MNLEIISGPVIGGVIGYFTNYIAVKMLFKPYNPIKIGKYTIPFTPGIIPKGKDRVAKALGSMVADTLLTEDDIINTLLNEDIIKTIQDGVITYIYRHDDAHITVSNILDKFIKEDKIDDIREKIVSFLTTKIVDVLENEDIGNIIATEGAKTIKDKLPPALALFVNDKMISSIASSLGGGVNEFIKAKGEDYVFPVVCKECGKLENSTVKSLLDIVDIDEIRLRNIIEEVYKRFVREKASVILKKINISSIVEEKIKEMNMRELEELVLSVMKKELNAIVNLGALIGFIIGILNIFI